VRYLVGFAVLVVGVAAHAATPDRDKLIGSWEARGSGAGGTVWTVASVGDSVRITETENEKQVSQIECNTLGRQCELKQAGKPVKVSMWFNGPKLVVMEVRGEEVLKRRFHAADDGNSMELEVIHIAPSGKPELLRLARTPASH
jgi:hypothetical protein